MRYTYDLEILLVIVGSSDTLPYATYRVEDQGV